MLDEKLLKAISRGRCFVLVGSGPSCEMGYPSWKKLAEGVYKELTNRGVVNDEKSYDKYLKENKYPELFSQAERDAGGRESLISILRPLMLPAQISKGSIYEKLAKWPIACYMTTNYDNELKSHLDQIRLHFEVLRNRKEDFCVIRDGVSNIILKLHSDLDYPNEIVITSADYQHFYVEAEGQYYRDKLRQIFEMFDVLIIGHSMSDPDIDYILMMAKQTASPSHPVYMVAADFTQAEEIEYREKYNIVLLKYSNIDGQHTQLKQQLSIADKFIVSRESNSPTQIFGTINPEEVKAATSLFLHRKLQPLQTLNNISMLVLSTLPRFNETGMLAEDLFLKYPLSTFTRNGHNNDTVNESLKELIKDLLVEKVNTSYRLTEKGTNQVQECHSNRDFEKRLAYGQFSSDLKGIFGNLTQEQEITCLELAEKTIVSTFKNRGLTIANKVFTGQSASSDELTDIFGNISRSASALSNSDLRIAFMDAMHNFIISPSEPQINYLASVSQGYFLYHLLGLDPMYAKLQSEIFKSTLWLLDSNILLPFLAIGSFNHDYAKELFRLLSVSGAILYSTHKLMQEVKSHFSWANQFVKHQNPESSAFMQAALGKGSYKENLFIDAYIRLCADGTIGTFEDYLEKIRMAKSNFTSFEEQLAELGIRTIEPSGINGFEQNDWGEMEQAKKVLCESRIQHGSYRSELQVECEAEIQIIIDNLRRGKYLLPDVEGMEKCYFISRSRILDIVFPNTSVTTWVPEAVYRYLSSLSNQITDPNLLHQCMLNEYFYAGISFIDKKSYLRFFGATIDTAKISYKKEKLKYIKCVENISINDLDEEFQKTPDLEKPFFVSQMGFKIADFANKRAAEAEEKVKRITDTANKRLIESAQRVKQLETARDNAWKIRDKRKKAQEAGRLRNLGDPKHLRKRERQAKKRNRRKKKG